MGFPGTGTRPVGVLADTLILAGVDHNQDVSMKSPFLVDSARICRAVSLSMTTIVPPQSFPLRLPMAYRRPVCAWADARFPDVQNLDLTGLF
jgi:hypothetical protein